MTTPAAQPGLFDLPTCSGCGAVGYQTGHTYCQRRLVGRTDPQTSVDAARKLIAGDGLSVARRRTLNLVRLRPGSTTKELGITAAATDPEHRDAEWHRQACGRRLSELERAGKAERGAPRDGCTTWYPKGGR